MSENNDYIQLPPLKKDTPSDVVAFMWEYMKVPELNTPLSLQQNIFHLMKLKFIIFYQVIPQSLLLQMQPPNTVQ